MTKTKDEIMIDKVEEVFLEQGGEDEESSEKIIPKTDGKSLAFISIAIIGIFALFFASFYFYNNYITTAGIINIDDLHEKNLNDELDEEEGYVYNGFSFVKADGMWWTELNKFGIRLKVPLHFGPKEVEDIEIKGNLDTFFNEGEDVYVAIDPAVYNKYYTLGLSELSFNLVKGMDRAPIGSCTTVSPDCDNRTIISCNNTKGKPVIELALAEEPSIDLSGTCIKISGKEYGIVKAVDRLLYQWYGVIS